MSLIYQTPFTDEDLSLLSEALHALLGVKQEALKTVNTAGLQSAPRMAFTEADFGIPAIRALIKGVADRMDESEEDEDDPEFCECGRNWEACATREGASVCMDRDEFLKHGEEEADATN
jgi:hypothetical protein